MTLTHNIIKRGVTMQMGIDTAEILQTVLDNINDNVLLVSKNHKVICFNDLARHTLRLIHNKEVSTGQDYRTFVSDVNKGTYLGGFGRAINGEKVFAERQLALGNRKAWFRLQTSPMYNKEGVICGAVLTLTDINEQKTQAAELNASEVKFRNAFEHSSIAVALVSADGKWLKVNKTLCSIVGYTENELLGQSPANITHPDDRACYLQQEQEVAEGKIPSYSMEKRFVHKSGREEWISGVVSPIREQGEIAYYIWQLRHISERRQMIERLKASEDLLRIFVQHSPAALAMFDREMRYVQHSLRWVKDYHLGSESILGKSHYEVFPTLGQTWKDIHNRSMAGMVQQREEDFFEREDGNLEWLRWEIHPWRRETGEPGGIIMLTEVITERKNMEIERQRIITDLVNRNRDLNEFAALVSHNLRGPLATIMGLSNLLGDNLPDPEKDVIVAGIGTSASQLDAVVRQMNTILNEKKQQP